MKKNYLGLILLIILLTLLAVFFDGIKSSQNNQKINNKENTPPAQPVDTTAPVISFVLPTPTNGSTVNSRTEEISANITGDSSVLSSFIDFDGSLLLWLGMQYNALDGSSYIRNVDAMNGINYVPGLFGNTANNFSDSSRIIVPAFDLSKTNKVTLAFWFKTTVKTSGLDSITLVEHSSDYNINNAFIVELGDQGGNGRINLSDHTASGYNLVYSRKKYNDGLWHHFVGTIDRSLGSSQNKIYVDGVLDTYQNPSRFSDNNGNFSNFDLNSFSYISWKISLKRPSYFFKIVFLVLM